MCIRDSSWEIHPWSIDLSVWNKLSCAFAAFCAAVIIGGDEAAAGTVTVRDLRGRSSDGQAEQQTISRDDLVPTLRTILETEPRS